MTKSLSPALLLTLSRIVLGPLFLCVYLYHTQVGISLIALPYVLLLVVCLSELSDLFDGRLARKQNRVTDLGKLLDPMADSIFRLSVLFSFTQGFVALPISLVCLFFYRDMMIGTLRTICALQGEALAARLSGKIKAIIQAIISVLIIILMIPYSMGVLSLDLLQKISFYGVLLGAVYTLGSGIEYFYAHRQSLKKVID